MTTPSWCAPVISSRNPATRRLRSTLTWRRGRRHWIDSLPSAEPMPSTCQVMAVSSGPISSGGNRIGLYRATECADEVIEYRDGELRERRVDSVDTRQQRRVDIPAGQLWCFDEVSRI